MTVDREFETRILAFERAWRGSNEPKIEEFLPEDRENKRNILRELICVDLEYRWRGGRPVVLEDYVRQFPELPASEPVLLELVIEEYRVRHRWGDRPSRDECQRRFPSLSDLRSRLREVDDELQREAAVLMPHVSLDHPLVSIPEGDIRLLRMIGSGGFGKVYVAKAKGFEKNVAVKFLRKSFWRNGAAVEQLLLEAEFVARVRHEGIVPIYGAGVARGGGPFLLMELIDGSDLAEVKRARQIPATDAVNWVAQACRAIAYAHMQGIVHCDLKPSNLLLDSHGRVRVTDFGLARRYDDHAGMSGGTAGFMAPEQLSSGLGPIGPATDVYGLGAVLAALLSPGRVALCSSIDDLPEQVRGICLRSFASEPGDRFGDAGELLEALDAISFG